MSKRSRHLRINFLAWVLSCLAWGGVGYLAAQHPGTYQRVNTPFSTQVSLAEVQSWLENRYAPVWGPDAGLHLDSDILSPGGRHLSFTQMYQGMPLFDHGVKINLYVHGAASLLSSIQPLPYPPVPSFSADTAALIIRILEEMGAGDYTLASGYQVKEGLPQPVYRVDAHPHYQSLHYRIWYDAATGTEREREVLNLFRRPLADTSGRAMVFVPDPCTRAQVSYGDLFTDNNDADNAIFHQLADTLPLRNLTLNNGTYRLTGPYVDIQDLAPRAVPVATSSSGDFFFTRDSAWFEDAMVYYHIDTFQRYVQTLGFNNLRNSNDPVQADPHGMNLSDNSSFVPGVRHLLFGEGGVDDAEDADVIVHEYGHALSDAASPNTNTGRERKGLDEGAGDYIAASYSFDSREFGWFNLFNWDGHNEFWTGRVAVSSVLYPPANTSMYVYGEIWSSTLMQLRQELGAAVMDRLFFQELYANYANMTLPDAALLVIDADSALFGGAHTQALQSAFCQRQILIGPSCLSVANEPLAAFGAYSWSLDAAAQTLTILGPADQEVTLEVFALDGRRLKLLNTSLPEKIVVPGSWSSGIYLLRITGKGGVPVFFKWRLP